MVRIYFPYFLKIKQVLYLIIKLKRPSQTLRYKSLFYGKSTLNKYQAWKFKKNYHAKPPLHILLPQFKHNFRKQELLC